MRELGLFAGIGAFSLGLEQAGLARPVAFVEIDPFCQKVLRKHWPDVPCHDNVLTREFVEGEAEIITAGFPCQDLSLAGTGAGLAGERSGLYREVVRAIRVVRPKYAILENVAALLSRGLGTVLGDLAEIGNDTEWHCIPASAVGAPHRRDRIWVVAYPDNQRAEYAKRHIGDKGALERDMFSGCRSDVADSSGARLAVRQSLTGYIATQLKATIRSGWWISEPNVGRMVNGSALRVDRLRSLGNSLVPQIPEIIGRAIRQATATPEDRGEAV